MSIFLTPPSNNESAKAAFTKAQKIGGRYVEGEQEISEDPYYSLEYALFLKSRFEKGEPAISKSAKLSATYAVKVIRGRFELGEKAISTNPYFTCAYLALSLSGVKVESIHREMLKNALGSHKEDYWTKEYFRYMEYLDGRGKEPYWVSKNSHINWF